MERDFNYMGGYMMPQMPMMNKWEKPMPYPMCECGMQPKLYSQWPQHMPPHMMPNPNMPGIGQGGFGRDTASYLMPGVCGGNCGTMQYGMMHQNMQPIDNLETDMHKFILTKIDFEIGNFVTINMGQMPEAIGKEKYMAMVNNIMAELTKDEGKIREMLRSRCTEEVEESRGFCPFCSGMLKTTVELMLLSQLVRRGCIFCY